MTNQWFRLYNEFAHDRKVQMLSEPDQRRLVMLMCMRSGNDNETFHDDVIAFQLRVSSDEWALTKKAFINLGFIDETNKLLNWNKRQYVSDTSTERVRKHREKKKHDCNVSVTPPESDTESDTDNNILLSDGIMVDFVDLGKELIEKHNLGNRTNFLPLQTWLNAGIKPDLIRRVVATVSERAAAGGRVINSFKFFETEIAKAQGLSKGNGGASPKKRTLTDVLNDEANK